MDEVTQKKSKSLRAHHKTGHLNVSGWNVRKSQASCTVPVSVPQANKKERKRDSLQQGVRVCERNNP